jgi:hypothetical protein
MRASPLAGPIYRKGGSTMAVSEPVARSPLPISLITTVRHRQLTID